MMRTLFRRSCRVAAISVFFGVWRATSEFTLMRGIVEPWEACADFSEGGYPGSAWTLDDCMEVWEKFSHAIPYGKQRRFAHFDVWKDTAAALRRAGSPCVLSSRPSGNGAGSSTIRHLASWILAEQLGCDWATPDWGKRPMREGNGTVWHCHKSATNDQTVEEKREQNRCFVVNWLQYFQFDIPSVKLPQDEAVGYTELGMNAVSLMALRDNIWRSGRFKKPGHRVVLTCHQSYGSHQLLNLGSWDEPKREVVRKVLKEARDNFHRFPRPWYNESPTCSYSPDKLHFAAHVRLGDRRAFQDAQVGYFEMLEGIMETISAEVVDKGLPEPMFHVFTETSMPCPSRVTGLFDEFPTWPVMEDELFNPSYTKVGVQCLEGGRLGAIDKVSKCWNAPPDDCEGRRAGTSCTPTRDGIFKVLGKNLFIHIDPDVQNALSCMIQADGLLMGCSTFGQVAGILSKGISMFSMQCGGDKTPDQYRMIPPLAVAERGYLWVPIAGSWRDPVLTSVSLFRGALDTFLSSKNLSV